MAKRLGLRISSLAKWLRQARIERSYFGPPEQGQLTSEERAELARRPSKDNRELRRKKDFFRLAAAHFAKEQLSPRCFA